MDWLNVILASFRNNELIILFLNEMLYSQTLVIFYKISLRNIRCVQSFFETPLTTFTTPCGRPLEWCVYVLKSFCVRVLHPIRFMSLLSLARGKHYCLLLYHHAIFHYMCYINIFVPPNTNVWMYVWIHVIPEWARMYVWREEDLYNVY